VKPASEPVPSAFVKAVSVKPFAWWRPNRPKRQPPWYYMFMNPYLFHWGSLFKFGPEGGAFYGQLFGRKTEEKIPDVFYADRAPRGSTPMRTAYLGREIRVAGAAWRFAGVGVVSSSWDGPVPDPGCVCLSSQLAVDPYGRVFAPDVFRFSVQMLDTNGNRLHRIGRYGNADDRQPEIAFAWPAFVDAADGKVYVSDTGNARVAVVRFDYAAEETLESL
jgi:hypothetical protein